MASSLPIMTKIINEVNRMYQNGKKTKKIKIGTAGYVYIERKVYGKVDYTEVSLYDNNDKLINRISLEIDKLTSALLMHICEFMRDVESMFKI